MGRIKIKKTITQNIKLIGEYQNGNYVTKIYEDGTRIRETNEKVLGPLLQKIVILKLQILAI